MTAIVFLNGMPGSGKSTFGRKLSRSLSFDFIDLDDFIAQETSMSPMQWILKHGEPRFREVESEQLNALIEKRRVVIACGGGTPCFNNNVYTMLQAGFGIYLKMSPKALYSRLSQQKGFEGRPLLNQEGKSKLLVLEETLAEREVFYNKMNLHVDGLHPNMQQVLDAIHLG
jgi:shikimate kinase